MRRRLELLKQYLRYKRHYAYVEARTLELRAKICSDATIHGTIGTVTRELKFCVESPPESLLVWNIVTKVSMAFG